MGFFDSLFSNSSGAQNPPGFSDLNNNVFFNSGNTPGFLANRPRLTRGLDNALLSAATFQSAGPTASAGENISAVGRNLMGLDSNRTSINMQRKLAPYLAMHPLLQMQGEMDKQSLEQAQAEEAKAHAAYFLAGGRELGQPKDYTDSQGNEWQIPSNGQARPVMGKPSVTSTVPDMQIGNTMIPGSVSQTNGPLQQLKGHVPGTASGSEIERLIGGEEAESIRNGGQPWSAVQRSNRWAELAGVRSGSQTSGRISNTPGFVSEADKLQLDKNLVPIDSELKQLNEDPFTWMMAHPGSDPKGRMQKRLSELQDQRTHMISGVNGGGNNSSSAPSGMMGIPQPIAPVATGGPNVMIGNTPGTLGGGATIGDLNNAIVPPGPKASRPAKPSPVKSARPKVTIDSKGNVSIG